MQPTSQVDTGGSASTLQPIVQAGLEPERSATAPTTTAPLGEVERAADGDIGTSNAHYVGKPVGDRLPAIHLQRVRVQTPVPVVATQRSDKYYYDDSSYLLFVQVDHTIYRLPVFLLQLRVRFISNVLAHPENTQGKTEDRPIVLRNISHQDFDSLVAYLWGDVIDLRLQPELPISVLISLWKSSRILDVPSATTFSVSRLKHLVVSGQLRPSAALRAAYQHGIHELVREGLHRLLQTALEEYTIQDYSDLGPRLLHSVIALKTKIRDSRTRLVSRTPDCTSSAECTTREWCQEMWEMLWSERMAERVLRSDDASVQDMWREMKDGGGDLMCRPCFEATVKSVGDAGSCEEENRIVGGGLAEMERKAVEGFSRNAVAER